MAGIQLITAQVLSRLCDGLQRCRYRKWVVLRLGCWTVVGGDLGWHRGVLVVGGFENDSGSGISDGRPGGGWFGADGLVLSATTFKSVMTEASR